MSHVTVCSCDEISAAIIGLSLLVVRTSTRCAQSESSWILVLTSSQDFAPLSELPKKIPLDVHTILLDLSRGKEQQAQFDARVPGLHANDPGVLSLDSYWTCYIKVVLETTRYRQLPMNNTEQLLEKKGREGRDSYRLSISEATEWQTIIDEWVEKTFHDVSALSDMVFDFGLFHRRQLTDFGVASLVDAFESIYNSDLLAIETLENDHIKSLYPKPKTIQWNKQRMYWFLSWKNEYGKRKTKIFRPTSNGGRLAALRKAKQYYEARYDIHPKVRLPCSGCQGVWKRGKHFVVKWTNEGIKRSRTFSITKVGSAKACEEAIQFRKQVDRRLEEVGQKGGYVLPEDQNKERGIRFCKSRRSWIAEYKKSCRYFPVSKYGKIGALELARIARKKAVMTKSLPSYEEIWQAWQHSVPYSGCVSPPGSYGK